MNGTEVVSLAKDFMDILYDDERNELEAYRLTGLSPEEVLRLKDLQLDKIKSELLKYLNNKPIGFTEFMDGSFVINLRTKEEYSKFLKICDERGMKWSSGRSLDPYDYDIYDTYGSYFCIRCCKNRLSYSDRNYFEEQRKQIIDIGQVL